jgi:hypothetical protein
MKESRFSMDIMKAAGSLYVVESIIEGLEDYDSAYKDYVSNILSFEKVRNFTARKVAEEEVSILLIFKESKDDEIQQLLDRPDIKEIRKELEFLELTKEIRIARLKEDAYQKCKKIYLARIAANKDILQEMRQIGIVSDTMYFENYLHDFFKQVFAQKPEVFKSEKKIDITYEEAVDCLTDPAFRELICEKVIQRVMSGTKEEWFDFIRTRVGVTVEFDLRLREVFAIRNCYVHNSGKVDRSLQAINPKFLLKLPIILSEEEYLNYVYVLNEKAGEIWTGYCRKFSIKDKLVEATKRAYRSMKKREASD